MNSEIEERDFILNKLLKYFNYVIPILILNMTIFMIVEKYVLKLNSINYYSFFIIIIMTLFLIVNYINLPPKMIKLYYYITLGMFFIVEFFALFNMKNIIGSNEIFFAFSNLNIYIINMFLFTAGLYRLTFLITTVLITSFAFYFYFFSLSLNMLLFKFSLPIIISVAATAFSYALFKFIEENRELNFFLKSKELELENDKEVVDKLNLKLSENIKNLNFEIKRNRELEKKMEISATFDEMTGAYNRKFGIPYVEKTLELAKREKVLSSIIFIDLDNLKMTNDAFGHEIGDRLITVFAKSVLKAIRQSDAFLRFGGDEFILLLYNCSKVEAEEKIDIFKENIYKENNELTSNLEIEFSYGIIEKSYKEDINIEILFKKADELMYQNKKGKNKN